MRGKRLPPGRALVAVAAAALVAAACPLTALPADAVAGGGAAGVPASAAPATAAVVSVDAGRSLATIPDTAFGLNVSVRDGRMAGSDVPGLLSDAGIGAVRYPGGSAGDLYHWRTHTLDGGDVAVGTDFDRFMATVRAAGAQPILVANHGTGTPQEAAGWVRYANVVRGYGVRYWEIGDEVYGNGQYGASWERDDHADHSATAYATELRRYAAAMKAVDPAVRIGATLVAPGTWPDGVTGPGDIADWNRTVLSLAADCLDFVSVHYHPASAGAADLLTRPATDVPAMARALRALVDRYAGARASRIGLAVTQTNGGHDFETVASALYAPDDYLTWLEHGAFTVDWWDVHRDGGTPPAGRACAPSCGSGLAPFDALRMLSRLGAPGDSLLAVSGGRSLLAAHAVRRADGDVDVMLVNHDPAAAVTVALTYRGFTPAPTAPTVWTYGPGADRPGTGVGSAVTGTAGSQTVPAYSIVVVQLHPA